MNRLPVISHVSQEVVMNQAWNDSPRRDDNDIPPECNLGQLCVDDRPFSDFDEGDDMCALHEMYARGSLRAVRVA